MRSPTKTGGSQPDLTKLRDSETKQTTARKRKQPDTDCSCVKNITDLKGDITKLLNEFVQSQNAHMILLREDVAQIKTQMENIRITTEYLVTEHSKILDEINDLKNEKTLTEQKIKTLENEIDTLKREACTEPINSLPINLRENLIREANERSNREKKYYNRWYSRIAWIS
ncbi:unnamed protein product [Parnassius apollo]|uniref:(apollo) hypothetical protein n=1 Tax=Parnassius apollo TaxID=110799 RepID=A0A8S3XZS9_PARAO|nr:unnamed protein product [Parnassius apollo]